MKRLLPLALVLFALGCDQSWTIDTAQQALTSGAEVVQALDTSVGVVLEQEVARIDRETDTTEAFMARLEPWRPVWMGVVITRAALFVAQRGIDAWRAGEGGAGFAVAGACILAGLTSVLEAPVLAPHRDAIPRELTSWISSFGALAAGVCDESVLDLDLEGDDGR